MVTTTPKIHSTHRPKVRPLASWVDCADRTFSCGVNGSSQRRQTTSVEKLTNPHPVHLMLFSDRSFSSDIGRVRASLLTLDARIA